MNDIQQNNISQILSEMDKEDEIDFKRILFLILSNWYWIVAFAIIGIAISFFYVQKHHVTYKTETTIMVPTSDDSFSLEQLFDEKLGGANKSIENELEIFKSYTLNFNTVKSLKWRAFWEVHNFIRWDGLYGKEPFTVLEPSDHQNPEGIYIYIKPTDANTYEVSASGTVLIKGVEKEIDLDATGKFGQPFVHDDFKFTILRNTGSDDIIDKDYRFIFKSFHKHALYYQKLLNAELTNKKSEVIRLSVKSAEPLRDVHYLNELIKNYLDDKLETKTRIQRQTLEFINQRLAGIADSMTTAGNTFNKFRSKNQIFDLSMQGQIIMENLSNIENDILLKKAEKEYYSNLIDYLNNKKNGEKLKAPSVAGIQDPLLNTLVSKLAELQSRKEMLSLSSHKDNPTLLRIDAEINDLRDQLNENLQSLLNNTDIALKSLETQKEEISKRLSGLPAKEQQLINISRQYEITSNLFELMLQKRAEFEIALASTVVNAKVIDRARIENRQPVGLSHFTIYLLGIFIGIIIALAFIFIRDFFDNKIHMQEDVEKLTDLTIMGHVLHNTGKRELMAVENPKAPLAESVRSIRTNIMFSLNGTDEKIISINSVLPGEGKTFISANIASVFAMNDKKTLLLGADMRKPRFSKIFDLPDDKGLSTYLIGESEYEEIVMPTKVENLFVITSGPLPHNPAELLGRDRFKTLLDRAREEFDYIIIDNSPASLVTDAFITGAAADLNIFVLRNGVSRKDQVEYINDFHKKGFMKRIALIINDVTPKRYGYGYYSTYKYAYMKEY